MHKGVIRIRKSKKYIIYNGENKLTKWQTVIYKTLHSGVISLHLIYISVYNILKYKSTQER